VESEEQAHNSILKELKEGDFVRIRSRALGYRKSDKRGWERARVVSIDKDIYFLRELGEYKSPRWFTDRDDGTRNYCANLADWEMQRINDPGVREDNSADREDRAA
jgi:hypothetical protein